MVYQMTSKCTEYDQLIYVYTYDRVEQHLIHAAVLVTVFDQIEQFSLD